MDISVIIPVFNSERYILDSVESLLTQDFTGTYEILVVDDCSTDNTATVLEKYRDEPRLRILRTPRNSGYPTAMNIGIDEAKGKYIARMDADDICHQSRLSVEFDLHEQHTDEIAFVSCTRFWLTYTGKPYHQAAKDDRPWKFETWQDLHENNRQFTDVGTLFLKDRAIAAGKYNTYQRTGMDVDMWLRIMELTEKPCMLIQAPMIGKRLLPDSLIFQPKTTNANKVPRILASFRKENKLPPHVRPSEQWLEETRASLPSAPGQYKKVSMIMEVAMINYYMNDIKGYLKFLSYACTRNFLQTLKLVGSYMIRPRRTGFIPGLPKISVTGSAAVLETI